MKNFKNFLIAFPAADIFNVHFTLFDTKYLNGSGRYFSYDFPYL